MPSRPEDDFPSQRASSKKPASNHDQRASLPEHNNKDHSNQRARILEAVLQKIHTNKNQATGFTGPGQSEKEEDKQGEALRQSAFSSGDLSLDLCLGGGFFPGSINEIYGAEESGKTALCLYAIADAQRKNQNFAAFIDADHAFDANYARKFGVDLNRLYLCQPDDGEEAFRVAGGLLRSSAFDIMVIDSVAGLVPQLEKQESFEQDERAWAHAHFMNQALRGIAPLVRQYNTCLLFTNQMRHRFDYVFGPREATTGGRALSFYANTRMELRKGPFLQVKKKVVGHMLKARLTKNKFAKPFQSCELAFLFEEGFDRARNLLDLSLRHGVVQRQQDDWGCRYFEWEDLVLGESKPEALEFLREYPEEMDRLSEALRAQLINEDSF